MQKGSSEEVKIYVVQISKNLDLPEFETALLSFLPEPHADRFSSYSHPSNRLRSIVGEVLSRYAICEFAGILNQDIRIGYGKNGKPYLVNKSDVHFNISHSGDFVVCAISENEIGVDVERIRKVNLRIAERYFSASELNDLLALSEEDRKTYFITLWTIKESYLKATGKGLTAHLNSFTVSKIKTGYKLTGSPDAESYHIETQQLSGEYMLACCMAQTNQSLTVQEISIEEITRSLSNH